MMQASHNRVLYKWSFLVPPI